MPLQPGHKLGPDEILAPIGAGAVTGFSLRPDGTRLLTSYANWPCDIWMVEGLNQ